MKRKMDNTTLENKWNELADNNALLPKLYEILSKMDNDLDRVRDNDEEYEKLIKLTDHARKNILSNIEKITNRISTLQVEIVLLAKNSKVSVQVNTPNEDDNTAK